MAHDYDAAARALADCQARIKSEEVALAAAERAKAATAKAKAAAERAEQEAEATVARERQAGLAVLEAHAEAARKTERGEVQAQITDLTHVNVALAARLESTENELASERRRHALAVQRAEAAEAESQKANEVLDLLREVVPAEA